MANFPTNLDTIKKDWANDSPVKDTHPDEHNLVAESVEALEAKVGVDGSAVTTTHDYKLSNVTDGDKAVSLTGTETLTNKTLTEPEITNPTGIVKGNVGLSNVSNNLQVNQAGDQTVEGVKTFSSSPIIPDPTTAQNPVTKQYFENAVGGNEINLEAGGMIKAGSVVGISNGSDRYPVYYQDKHTSTPVNVNSTQWAGQSFTAPADMDVDFIGMLTQQNTFTGTVRIRASLTGPDLATGSTSSGLGSVGVVLWGFTLNTTLSLVQGNRYYIIYYASGDKQLYGNSGSTLLPGESTYFSSNSGSSWSTGLGSIGTLYFAFFNTLPIGKLVPIVAPNLFRTGGSNVDGNPWSIYPDDLAIGEISDNIIISGVVSLAGVTPGDVYGTLNYSANNYDIGGYGNVSTITNFFKAISSDKVIIVPSL